MTTANIKEQRKLKAQAKARRAANKSSLKSDSSGLQTRTTWKKKTGADRKTQMISETHSDLPNPPHSPSNKEAKTMMADPSNSVNHIILALMQEPRQGSQQHRPIFQFKFWDNSFDGLKFLYDHLNSDDDVVK